MSIWKLKTFAHQGRRWQKWIGTNGRSTEARRKVLHLQLLPLYWVLMLDTVVNGLEGCHSRWAQVTSSSERTGRDVKLLECSADVETGAGSCVRSARKGGFGTTFTRKHNSDSTRTNTSGSSSVGLGLTQLQGWSARLSGGQSQIVSYVTIAKWLQSTRSVPWGPEFNIPEQRQTLALPLCMGMVHSTAACSRSTHLDLPLVSKCKAEQSRESHPSAQ